MNRAMYSGVAGLRTHQTRMDVIGNNIANVNTVGYKSQAALFSDLLYQNSSNASGPNNETGRGGINAKQIGLGAKMASISTNITLPGSAETTNNPFDIRITGKAFFVVNDGRNNMFTRDGSFKVDAAGNLVMSSNGYMVMGWLPDPDNPTTIKPDTMTALSIMNATNMTYPAEATTQAYVSGIVDAESPEVNSEDGKIMNLNFYDARGYSYTAKLALKRVADSGTNVNSYSCELTKLLDASGNDITASVGATMDNTTVAFQDPEKKTLLSGYKLSGTGPAYKIDHVVDAKTGEHITYSIADGANGVTAIRYANSTDTTGTAMTDAEAWDGVAKALGYESGDELKKMRSAVTTGTPPNTTTTTYEAGTQLGSLLQANGMSENADGTPAEGADAGSVSFTGKNITGCVVNFSKADGSFVGVGGEGNNYATLNFGTMPDAASFSQIRIDFSALSNQGNQKVTTASATNGSLANASIGAGRMVGNMSGISIQNDGKIYATYDNGQSKLIAQIAVARFANAAGLEKAGDNLYKASQNSGDFDGIGVDITSDGGYMTPGELEMSNVDLSSELTNMIVTQRGFQANSRIITVSDTMLEELVNLKR